MLYTPHHYVLQLFILFIVKTPAQGQECVEERWSTLHDDAAGARGPDRHGGSLGPGQGAGGEHQTSKLVQTFRSYS